MLNTEIDTIEEQNKVIAQEIRKHELKGDLSEKEKQAAIDELQEEIDIAHSLKKNKEDQNKDTEDKLATMQSSVQVRLHFLLIENGIYVYRF
jgi:fructose-1,6-bisphosphatase